MDNAIVEELASYKEKLVEAGFHPQTIRAYSRKLKEFLEACPGAIDAGKEEAAEAIESHIASSPTAYDDFMLSAGLRKWHLLRFGEKLGKIRLDPASFATSPQIAAEVGRYRMSGWSFFSCALRRASGSIPSNLESTRNMRSMRRRASRASESAP